MADGDIEVTPETKPGGIRRRIGCGCVVLLLMVLFAPFLLVNLFRMGGPLLFGWIPFLGRTLPEISLNWDLIGMAGLCFVILFLAVHYLVTWGISARPSEPAVKPQWRRGQTFAVLCAIGVMFLAGMAMGGIAHQIGWLLNSDQPMVEAKQRYYRNIAEMKQLAGGFEQAMLEHKGDLAEVQQELWQEGAYLKSPAKFKLAYRILVSSSNVGTKDFDYVIHPRNSSLGEKAGGFRGITGGKGDFVGWIAILDFIEDRKSSLQPL